MKFTLKRAMTGGAIAVAVALLTASCSSSSAPAGGSGSTSSFKPTTIKLAFPTGVTSFANSDIVVAQKMGYFKDLGLTVNTTNLNAGGDSVKGVVSGSFDIGGASIEPVINAFAGGADLRIIGSYADRLEVDLVTPDSITSVKQLKGKNLGVQAVGSFREVMTRMALEGAGLTRSDVHYIPTPAQNVVSGLIQGRIASGILHPEQFIAAKEKDPHLHALVNLSKVEPKYFYGTYFTTKEWLDAHPQAAVRFTEALVKAHRLMYKNEAKVVPIIAQATKYPESVIKQAWTIYMKQIQVYAKNEGLDMSRIDYTVKRMKELKTLRAGSTPDMKKLVDRGPITQAVKKLGKVPGRNSG